MNLRASAHDGSALWQELSFVVTVALDGLLGRIDVPLLDRLRIADRLGNLDSVVSFCRVRRLRASR